MQRVSPTPLRLAKLTLVGSAIVILAFAEAFLPFPSPLRHHGFVAMLWSERLELLCVVLPMLTGIAVLYYNNYRLSNGVNHLRFTDEELDEARHFIYLPWLTYTQVAALLIVVVLCVIQFSSHRFVGNSPVILLLGINPLNYLRTTLRKAPSKASPIDWRKAQPIRSDHWGETT